jgi:hypothetical protein
VRTPVWALVAYYEGAAGRDAARVAAAYALPLPAVEAALAYFEAPPAPARPAQCYERRIWGPPGGVLPLRDGAAPAPVYRRPYTPAARCGKGRSEGAEGATSCVAGDRRRDLCFDDLVAGASAGAVKEAATRRPSRVAG